MYILLAGLSHKTAPVEMREKFALNGKALVRAYDDLKGIAALEGVVVLSTCNRTEIYASVRDVSQGSELLHAYLAERLDVGEEVLSDALYELNCYDAIEHLFRVAAGLDSMVLGESQILGQVREAYEQAKEQGASNGVLNTLFQRAISVGKRVRTETELDRHAVSISYAAVEKARQVFGNLNGKSVLVIGAGKMSELALNYLMANGVASVIVSNRSFDRAVCLAEKIGGQAVGFEHLAREMETTDIVISCTAANHYVLRRDNIFEQLSARDKPIMLIDIAVPRDIDPELGIIPGVHLYDIDDLHNVVRSNMISRQRAAIEAEKIINEEIEEFNNWMATLSIIPVVKALKNRAAEIRAAELSRALNRLGEVTPREEQIISAMASSITNQLIHFPIISLKDKAISTEGHLYAEIVKKLFELNVDSEEYGDEKNQDRVARK